MSKLSPFHLAIAVDSLSGARAFYGSLLGCEEGRSADQWVDFNFFGHQLVCHLETGAQGTARDLHNPVDGHNVPIPHFGLVLDMSAWEKIRGRLESAGVEFVIEPNIRFKGLPGEQATLFFRDPAGNNLEIKAFANLDQLFVK